MQKESKWTVLDTQVPKTFLYTDIFKVLLAWWNVSKVNIFYDLTYLVVVIPPYMMTSG
jgi:hypothetical protein